MASSSRNARASVAPLALIGPDGRMQNQLDALIGQGIGPMDNKPIPLALPRFADEIDLDRYRGACTPTASRR
jgi:hypothetical protein